jgi:DNA-binding winged helix-turn-helix (wHTH) protein/predicted ATPase
VVYRVNEERRIRFDPFDLDLVNECLWRGSQSIKLRPKAFAVLEHLLGHPGQLVTKENLIAAAWGETFVGDGVLKVTIRQLREALDDDPRSPRFIETSHRRGYRFIGRVDAHTTSRADDDRAGVVSWPVLDRPAIGRRIVGRERALSRMQAWLEKVRAGERQIVFVSGEAGIGKTTLLDAFVRSIDVDRDVRIATGQCLEQYGTGEAYLPVLEAIRELCRLHPSVVDVLRAHAPMWLLQMPSLVRAEDREAFGRDVSGATRERMLRELGDALDALTAEAPLVLVLEDLHWSDYSTLDLISYLARQRGGARLMVVGTYRPAELIASGHPLKAVKQELVAKQQCEELPLEYLSEQAVAEYLAVRFPAHRFPGELAALIHDRTEGNALFMVNTVDYLVGEGLVAEDETGARLTAEIDRIKLGVPDSIRNLIENQIDHLEPREQRMLEAASVAGAEFSPYAVAAAFEEDEAAIESTCEELRRRHQFIRDSGLQTLPGGLVVGRFSFVHAVYRSVFYERISAARRVLLHKRMAVRGEQVYGERASEIAAELAMHFERASDHAKAARYLQVAAANAMRRSAYREAVALSRRGLELLAWLPETPGRIQQELELQLTLGVPLIATEGYAAASVGEVYHRARVLCDRLGDRPEIAQVLWGLWTFTILRANLTAAIDIASEFLQLAGRLSYSGMAMRGHWALEVTFTHRGEFPLAVEHFEKALSLYLPDRHRDDAFLFALDPGVAMRCFAAWSLWFCGRPAESLVRMQEALTQARELSEPHSLAHALGFAAMLHQFRRERQATLEYADAALALSTEHGLVLYQAIGTVLRGWALVGDSDNEDAIRQVRQGLAAWLSTGAQLMRPHILGLLAEALLAASHTEEGLEVVDEALAIIGATGERCFEAELYRLKGELLLTSDSSAIDAAEGSFLQALATAREQRARAVELRAAMSLVRLTESHGRRHSALALIQPILESFTEGLDTLEVAEAQALLDAEITA